MEPKLPDLSLQGLTSAAVATLEHLGYTFEGGEQWKPPVGKPRFPVLRQTRTYVELGLSQPAYDEIREKLRAAGYDHALGQDGAVDLHGLAAVLDPDAEPRVTVAIDARVPPPSDAQLRKAMHRAFTLGQTYWQQADSHSTADHRRSDETQAKFDALVNETAAALAPGGQP